MYACYVYSCVGEDECVGLECAWGVYGWIVDPVM